MSELIVVGDRVLVKPQTGERETEAGLLLPASVTEQEKVRSGRVVRTGPGYVMPNPEYTEGEAWKGSNEVRYLPLQARPGDVAFFLKKEAFRLSYQGEDYLILPHAAILALVRPDPDDLLEGAGDDPLGLT